MLLMNNFILNLADLGQSFKSERKALGLTQAQVAEKSGLRRETIIQMEAGENVQVSTFIQAISALGKGIKIVDRRIDYDQLQELFNDQ